ncbi:hypothetical protein H4582DRAFT_2077126 [Lactarius indigo]|nr:hypothetical protein H4582DRAFT_2077126 [Lactarius indigo]
MGDSPMVVMWPPHGADGEYSSVALSQRKAPYEVMPTPDPHPPFVAKLSLTDTYVRAPLISFQFLLSKESFCKVTVENPQIAFTRNAPPDGMQNIIWAFSRMPPGSDDPDAPISIHHKVGRGKLNLTRIPPIPAEPPEPLPPPPPPVHPGHSHTHPEDEDNHDDDDDEKAEDEGENHDDDRQAGWFCELGARRALYCGVLARVAVWAFFLHRLLQFGVAGASIVGGTLAYLFMDDHSSGMAQNVKLWEVPALYFCTSCNARIGSWVHRIPAESRTSAHGALLAGLGATIVLLAFVETWLGLISAGRSTLVWSALLFVVPSLYVVGAMTVQRRFGSVKEDAKGEYVALDTRPPSNDELEDGDEKL